MERQRALLKGRAEHANYEDVLKGRLLKVRNPKDLIDRANALHPSTRKGEETLYVASLVCLAWSIPDLSSVLAQAAERNMTVTALDTGLELPPGSGMAVLNQAVQTYNSGRRKVASLPGQTLGFVKSAEKRTADRERRLSLIADDWSKREFSTPELLLRAGINGKPMSYNTAKLHLGRRSIEQNIRQRTEEASAAYQARKAAKNEL